MRNRFVKIFSIYALLTISLVLTGTTSAIAGPQPGKTMVGSWVVHSTVNIIFQYRPDWFNKRQRSLILGLLGVEFEEGLIRYFFS